MLPPAATHERSYRDPGCEPLTRALGTRWIVVLDHLTTIVIVLDVCLLLSGCDSGGSAPPGIAAGVFAVMSAAWKARALFRDPLINDDPKKEDIKEAGTVYGEHVKFFLRERAKAHLAVSRTGRRGDRHRRRVRPGEGVHRRRHRARQRQPEALDHRRRRAADPPRLHDMLRATSTTPRRPTTSEARTTAGAGTARSRSCGAAPPSSRPSGRRTSPPTR